MHNCITFQSYPPTTRETNQYHFPFSVQLLKQRDKNSSQEWLNKLPQMVKQLEVSLYRSAPSFEAYADRSTLKHRLQLLAMEIAKKTHTSGGDERSKNGGDKLRDNIIGGGGGGGSNQSRRQSEQQQQPPPPQPQRPQQQQARPQQPPHPSHPQQPRMGGYPNHNGMSSNGGRLVDVHHGGGHRGQMNTQGSMRMDQPPGPMSNSMRNSWQHPRSSDQGTVRSRDSSNSNKPQVVNLGQINNMMGNGSVTPTQGMSSSINGPGSNSNSKVSEKEWQSRIKHKQQRLLLLHHSSKCQNADGKCPVTPHCADMKRLWIHMAKCEDNRCQVPHCYSSRAILSHYRKCKDPECQACGPVRETVWRVKGTKSGSKSGSSSRPNNGGPSSSSNNNVSPRSGLDIDGTFRPTQSQQPPVSSGSSSNLLPIPQSSNVPQQPLQAPPQPPRKSSVPSSGSSISSRDTAVDPKIKHKQQRLLLLRHASKCTAKEGQCTKTPHCAEMKELWKHISGCHNSKCTYPHCLSSRYVLMHYRKCKDPRCPACAPVRASIREGSTTPPDKLLTNSSGEEKPTKKPKVEPKPDTRPPEPSPKPSAQPTSNNESESYSIMHNFTVEQIELHLQSLKQTYTLPVKIMKEKCVEIMKVLQGHEYYWVFSDPVDPVKLGLPDYFDVIKKPMDLGTVQKKLDTGQYHSIDDFNCDIRLTFDNALTYNEAGSVVNGMATQMKAQYEVKYEELLNHCRKEEADRMTNERACALCGFEKLQFEPPVFFCNNLKCPSKRIRRNTHFYTGGNNQYHYCSQCFNDLDEDQVLELPDMTLKKGDLKKKKNDEVHEESWVNCDDCNRWVHQICGLFNQRQNKNNSSTYSCPRCLLDRRKKCENPGKTRALSAQQLPRTKLSEWIEDYITPKVAKQYKVLAEEKSEVEVSDKLIFIEFLR